MYSTIRIKQFKFDDRNSKMNIQKSKSITLTTKIFIELTNFRKNYKILIKSITCGITKYVQVQFFVRLNSELMH